MKDLSINWVKLELISYKDKYHQDALTCFQVIIMFLVTVTICKYGRKRSNALTHGRDEEAVCGLLDYKLQRRILDSTLKILAPVFLYLCS